ncbi:MAG: hypothetical protein Q4C54_06175 [Clostridia bacterium]|nr:hypothetical protein [Clostridia bacterium]
MWKLGGAETERDSLTGLSYAISLKDETSGEPVAAEVTLSVPVGDNQLLLDEELHVVELPAAIMLPVTIYIVDSDKTADDAEDEIALLEMTDEATGLTAAISADALAEGMVPVLMVEQTEIYEEELPELADLFDGAPVKAYALVVTLMDEVTGETIETTAKLSLPVEAGTHLYYASLATVEEQPFMATLPVTLIVAAAEEEAAEEAQPIVLTDEATGLTVTLDAAEVGEGIVPVLAVEDPAAYEANEEADADTTEEEEAPEQQVSGSLSGEAVTAYFVRVYDEATGENLTVNALAEMPVADDAVLSLEDGTVITEQPFAIVLPGMLSITAKVENAQPQPATYELTDEATGVVVRFTADALPEGILPENVAVTAQQVELDEDTIAALTEAGRTISYYVAYDITLLDTATGMAFEPVAPISVTMPAQPESEENPLTLAHIDDNKTIEQLDAFDVEDGQVSFQAESFSVYVLAEQGETPLSYEYSVQWSNGISASVVDYSYREENGRQVLHFHPATNGPKTATLNFQVTVHGSDNLFLEVGAVKVRVPKNIFTDRYGTTNVLADNTAKPGYAPFTSWQPSLTWQLVEAPQVSSICDFNYTEDPADPDYYIVTNYKRLPAGDNLFSVDIGYRFTPTRIQGGYVVSGTYGTADAVYDTDSHFVKEVPITLTIDNSQVDNTTPVVTDTIYNKVEVHTRSVTAESNRQPTKYTAMAGNDQNGGVYMAWQSSWGSKPADADDYFYVIWQADLNRYHYMSQPYDIQLGMKEGTLAVTPYKEFVSKQYRNPLQNDAGNDITYNAELIGVTYYGNGTIKKNDETGEFEMYYGPGFSEGATSTGLKTKGYQGIASGDYLSRLCKFAAIDDQDQEHPVYEYRRQYTNSVNYGAQNYLSYGFLVRYPRTMLDDVDRIWGTDVLLGDGIKLKPPVLTWEETPRDGGASRNGEFTGSSPVTIRRIANGGAPGFSKFMSENVANADNGPTKGGQEALLRGLTVHRGMYYNVASKPRIMPNWNAETQEYFFDSPWRTIITDDVSQMYLHSRLKGSTISNARADYDKTYGGKIAPPEQLQEGDVYFYKVVFSGSIAEYDASFAGGDWSMAAVASTDYAKLAKYPYEIWIRYEGTSEFVHYQDLWLRAGNNCGTMDVKTPDGTIVQKNVLLSAGTTLPDKVCGVKVIHDSEFLKSTYSFLFYARLRGTEHVRQRVLLDKVNSQNPDMDTFDGTYWTDFGKYEITQAGAAPYYNYEYDSLVTGVAARTRRYDPLDV